MRNHQKVYVLERLIYKLMRRAWRYFDALAFTQYDARSVHFENGAPTQDKKELASGCMKMARFLCAGWHTLGDYRHVGSLDEMPSIANISPRVMLGGSAVDWLHSGLT